MSWFKREIADGVTIVRILNTKLPRFENFWPIPRGTSYNFYVVRGSEKVALIDGADFRFSKEFFEALESVVDVKEIDYVVTQHTEPDHSGTLADVMKRASGAVLLGTRQALSIGEALADFPMDRAREVEDGEELDLGGKTLRFVISPMVHWPDTMLTYLREDSILFTCDLFGSHGASEKLFYDEAPSEFELVDYYASILMPYHAMAARAVAKVRELGPKIIAPSHGALHRKLDELLEMYERWTSWKPDKKALIVVGSQYENTARAAEAAAEGLREGGLEVITVDSAEVDPDDLLAHTLESAAILIAVATHNGHPFLGITFFLDLLKEYRPKNKVAAVLGSFGWGGGGTRAVKKELEALSIPVIDELTFKGKPREEDLARARELGKRLAEEALRVIGPS